MQASSPATQDEIQQELSRVLASRQFADSPRLSRFLAYVVEQSLAAETEQLKEYSLGLAVFDRPSHFDPRLDTIVRVQASKLRGRLADYYGSEGALNPVRIQLPRGTYVPAFEYARSETAAPETEDPARSRRSSPFVIWAAAAFALTAVFAAGYVSGVRFRPKPAEAAPIRFLIPAPSGYRFIGPAQVSADGKKVLSTVLIKAESQTAIYLHNLESGAGGLIPGTRDGTFPYWSPNGKTIVFSKISGLYRLDPGGDAEPVLVAPVGASFGLDWNQNGVILMGGNPGPVWRTSLSGAGVTAVTDPGRPEAAHLYPRFLPDGNHFLYLIRNETPDESAIYVGSLDGKTKKRILHADTRANFAPGPESSRESGHILFVRDGRLMAQPFDLRRLELTGTARPLAEGVPQLAYGASTFSASAHVVVYGTTLGTAGRLAWFDRTGKPAGELGPVGDPGDPVLSPDGDKVAFDNAEGANRDIWTVEIKSGKTTRITFDPEVDHAPAWSPDGTRIVFESHRTPAGLYVAGAEGGAADSLVLAGGDTMSEFSPDGAFVLFESMRSVPKPPAIWLFPLTGERQPRVWLRSEKRLARPVLSPNGKWIAYVAGEPGRSDVYVQRFGAGSVPGSGKWEVSVAGGSQPAWRADGKELYYLSPDNALMAASVTTGDAFTYTRPIRLFETRLRVLRGPRNDYAVRDGNRFLFRVPAQGVPDAPLHVVMNWPAVVAN